ncbi:MAG: indolepyruvate ferredoxin oxidoreductase subunit alpha [Oscillospiraceae bacterium]|nr:indolepyruvate ferredoxin oxidoreductase subunit alpha [Oscillospiraceae bacterium]
MKTLMLGNAAVARGLYEAGCQVASSYPGTPSTEITQSISEYDEIYSEWATNEKVAMEVAFGASLAGKRSFTGMKHVGLNVAADPLFTLSYTGVNAGMVIAVADDPGMHSSQNEQDSRHYARAAKLPMLEPADSSECLQFAKIAYELSEKYDTPVLIRMCTRIAHSQSIVELSERKEQPTKEYVKNAPKYVMMPGFARARHPILESRMRDLVDMAEETPLNRVEMGGTEIGVVTSGTAYQYVKEAFGDSVSVLKLGMVHPLPEKLIIDFASKVKKLVVVEELDSIIEDHCKKIGLAVTGKDIFPLEGEFSQNLVAEKLGAPDIQKPQLEEAVPQRPPVMCAGCSHRGLFYTLSKLKATVLGDIGCYTLGSTPPLSAMDSTICMGASISSLHGFARAGGKNCVCVVGDSTFIHMGVGGLIDIAYNGSDSTVIILDNSTTGMTGHQDNPTTGYNIKGEPAGKIDLEALCEAIGIKRVRVVDPYDLKACEEAVKEEMAASGPSVIIARRPCALLKTTKTKPPLTVDKEKCTGCKICMRLGCPAISIKDKKADINQTLCVGCDLCSQLCKFGAFVKTAREG